MREIKFRAWDGKNMDYNPVCCTDGPETTNLNSNIQSMCEDWHQPKYLTLMQYTGLKDKNGKEIYEGDLVEITQGKYKWRYKIVWDDYLCEVVAKTFWRNFYFDEDGNYIFKDTLTDRGGANLSSVFKGEVIGNIYENPELLK